MSSVRGAISNIRHYLNTIEREIAGYTTIDQRSRRRQPPKRPAYRFKRKSFYKIHRHESSDEEDSSDEDEDSSEDEEDSSDEETVSFDDLAHELIEFYERYGYKSIKNRLF